MFIRERVQHAARKKVQQFALMFFAAVMVAVLGIPARTNAIVSNDAIARECKVSTVIGHRGTTAQGVRENSMAAFKKAVADGATVIEIDIHRTGTYKDPKTKKKVYKWVIAHDSRIKGRSIKKTSYPTLKRLDPNLVTLDEFLGYMRTTNRRAFIEIKPGSITKPAARKLAAQINAYGMTSRTEIHSFHEKVLRKFNKYKKYSIRTGYIVNRASKLKSPETMNNFANSLVLRNDLVKSVAQINAYKRARLSTYVYTLNSPAVWIRYSGYGLNGMITDVTGTYRQWCAGVQPKPPVVTPPPVTPPQPPVEPPVDPPAPETPQPEEPDSEEPDDATTPDPA